MQEEPKAYHSNKSSRPGHGCAPNGQNPKTNMIHHLSHLAILNVSSLEAQPNARRLTVGWLSLG